MRLVTPEAQRPREIEDGKDPRASPVIGAAIEVQRNLGPDFWSRHTRSDFVTNFSCLEMDFKRQVALPLLDKGLKLECGYKLDLIVRDEVILELKAIIEELLPIHEAQLLTYLRLTGKRVGLLINFNVVLLAQGIMRIVL